jgi:hypothetical protein
VLFAWHQLNSLTTFSSVFITPHASGKPTASHKNIRRDFMDGDSGVRRDQAGAGAA